MTISLNPSVIHVEESDNMSIPSYLSVSSILFAISDPAAMQAVAAPSASMQEGATTVALITSVDTGRPVKGEIVCPIIPLSVFL